MIVLDFETAGIAGNPTLRPPAPVGLAYKRPGQAGAYMGWGHPTGNNTNGPAAAKRLIAQAIARKEPLLFHNSKFDIAVAEHHFGLKFPDPLLINDTLFQVFLHDPYASSFSLKPSAERLLGIAPEERDAVRDWVLSHIPCAPSEWGAHIADAPGELVAPYAIGDVDRTLALYEYLQGKVPREPYQREQRLRPIVMESERRGIHVNVDLMATHMDKYETALVLCDDEIRKVLKAPNVNLDSGTELADAVEVAGLNDGWVRTPTGKRSTARKALESVVTHPRLLALLRYRGALAHCLSNFGRPWLALTQIYNGRLHPEWNQVRQSRTEEQSGISKLKGTRTGRLSCSKPNFQNPPNEYEIIIPKGYPDLPLMRKYLIPDKGYTWIKRDYSQQELRILAHYSEGRLFQRYLENPRIDAHAETQALIKEFAHRELSRKHVKITGFSIIYGSGTTALSEMLGVPYSEGEKTKEAYFTALPEVRKLMRTCSDSGKSGIPITTWGGRHYKAEPPRINKKTQRMQTFEYKLLNYLIQGSGADCMKEAIIRWNEDKGTAQFLATVHDEDNCQSPTSEVTKDMKKLKNAMESIEFDVPMLTDGYKGRSWAELKECA